MIYITGDTHGRFKRIRDFCIDHNTTKDDVMIILGDSGINYFTDGLEKSIKKYIKDIPITLMCVHGNHEERAELIKSYKFDYVKTKDIEGNFYFEDEYPNILFFPMFDNFLIHGEPCLVVGGGYSIDKENRISLGMNWYESEELTNKEFQMLSDYLNDVNKFKYVFTHTCPISVEPHEFFLPNIDQSKISKRMEQYLESIKNKINFDNWYCGHFHCDKIDGKFRFMFSDIIELSPIDNKILIGE